MTGNPKIKAQYGAFDGTGDAASPNRFASRLSDVADLRGRRSLRALIQGKHSRVSDLPEFQEQPNGEISDPALSAAYDFKLYEHLLTVARRERRTRSAPRGSVTTFLRVGTKCSA